MIAGSPPGDLTAFDKAKVRSRAAEKERMVTIVKIRREETVNTVKV